MTTSLKNRMVVQKTSQSRQAIRLSRQNLKLSEAKNIYPSFAKIAYDEGFNDIGKSFEMVARVEETHHKMLQYLGNLYKSHSMYKRDHVTKWKCSNCGYVAEAKESYKICPLCALSQGYVIINMEDTDNQ